MNHQAFKDKVKRDFEEIFGRFYHEGEKTDFTATHITDFLDKALDEYRDEIVKDTMTSLFSAIKPVFNKWAGESKYVTGAWSEGEYIDSNKSGEYWDEQRRTAWEQFARRLDNAIAMKTLEEIELLTGDTKQDEEEDSQHE